MVELPRQAHGAGKVIGAHHDGVQTRLGKDGVQLFHGADVLDLGHQEDPGRRVPHVGIEIPAEGIGPAKAHAAVLAQGLSAPAAVVVAGIRGPADGLVQLFPALYHGKDQALCARLQRGLDGGLGSDGQTGKGRSPAALDGTEDVGQAGAAEGTMLHVHRHPVIAGTGHQLRHIGGRQLQPGADGGFILCQFGANIMNIHRKRLAAAGLGLCRKARSA